MKRFCITSLFLTVFLTIAVTAFAQPAASPARREAARLTASAKKLYESAQAAKKSSSTGINQINFRKAFDEANKAVAADPTFEISYFIRAQILGDMPASAEQVIRNRDAALADFGRAITLKPSFSLAYFWRGMLRLEMAESVGNANAMLEGFMAGAGVSKDVKVTDSRGNSRVSILDLALADFSRALSLERTYINHFGKAEAHLARGEFAKAKADYEASLKLNPAFQAAKDRLAKLPVESPGSRIAGEWDTSATFGTSKLPLRLRFFLNAGVLAGEVIADNGTKTPIRDLIVRPDRTYSFKIIASNGATLDCSGTISVDYRSMTGPTKIQVGKESATGTFSGTKRQ